jgi:chromosomal replication initiation ATPase DnaA
MTNHIHLVIQVAENHFSGIMQNLSFRYTRWMNNKQTRRGHLFQGRYKAILVDANTYLIELLEQILGKRIQPTPEVSLNEIVTYVSAEYAVNEEDLRGPSRNRVVCEVRAVIGWLSWRLESSSITDVAIYFQRESSTFSRPIRKIDAKAKNSDRLRDKLKGNINI